MSDYPDGISAEEDLHDAEVAIVASAAREAALMEALKVAGALARYVLALGRGGSLETLAQKVADAALANPSAAAAALLDRLKVAEGRPIGYALDLAEAERDALAARLQAVEADLGAARARIAEIEDCPDSQNENACGQCRACENVRATAALDQLVAARAEVDAWEGRWNVEQAHTERLLTSLRQDRRSLAAATGHVRALVRMHDYPSRLSDAEVRDAFDAARAWLDGRGS